MEGSEKNEQCGLSNSLLIIAILIYCARNIVIAFGKKNCFCTFKIKYDGVVGITVVFVI